jgi:hypothetical protein
MPKRKLDDIDNLCDAVYECKTSEQRAIVLYEPSPKRFRLNENEWLPSACLKEKQRVKMERIKAHNVHRSKSESSCQPLKHIGVNECECNHVDDNEHGNCKQ